MQRITFHSPTSVDDVCSLLDERPHETKVVAGGQSLIQMLKQRLVSAETIVDISSLEELTGIRREDGRIWIGAAETYADVQHHPLVADQLPVLSSAIATIGDTQIRNRGTLVGGIAHADPQGDPPVVATALDATIRIRHADGSRDVSGREFYRGLFETALEPTELVTEVGFPIRADRTTTFQSFTPRKGDYAVASVVVSAPTDATASAGDLEFTAGAVGDYPQFRTGADVDAGATELVAVDRESVAERVADAVTITGDEEWGEAYRRRVFEHHVSEALADVGVGTDAT
jgi:carbon-monoxide dehydrogenase medium subunit